MKRFPITAVLLAIVWASAAFASDGTSTENWPRFRGPDGLGKSVQTGLPIHWSDKDIVWKTRLKGRGQSSPIVWGDRIFLTTALDDGREREVLCIGAKDGKVLWEQTAWKGDPERSHPMNGWATSTCCTDGEHVYAWFGKAGVHCFTLDGKHVWSKELGLFQSDTKRGTASSPVLADDLLIVNGDSESDPFLFGLNKLTGDIVWKTQRKAEEGYSTPVLIDVSGHRELVLNGASFIAGYDPKTGKQLWSCKSFAGRGEPLPAVGDGVLYVINGLPGDIYAVRPGGSGDVTKTRMVWHTPRRGGRDTPSPILVNQYLIVSNMKGIACCYDPSTGKELWKTRIGGNITATPFQAEGKAYFLFEDGEVLVTEPAAQFKEIARNKIEAGSDEIFRASPVPCAGKILLRSDQVLYCIGSGDVAGTKQP
jgi:hypothetical protein